MEKKFAPETYQQAKNELDKIRHRCKIAEADKEPLVNALLDYYEMKRTDQAEASKLWGKIQQILDNCDLK